VYMGYNNYLRVKANEYQDIINMFNKWVMWGCRRQLENVYNNIDGDIIFCNKWDILKVAHYTKRNEEHIAREDVKRLKNRILKQTEYITAKCPILDDPKNQEKIKAWHENKKVCDENSKKAIKEAEQELPIAIEKYDCINKRLAEELGYDFVPYEKQDGIEVINDNEIIGQKQFETQLKSQLRVNLKPDEDFLNQLRWKWDDEEHRYKKQKQKYNYPQANDCHFQNGECFIIIKNNFCVMQQIWLKKDAKLPINPLQDTLFIPEMFSVTRKRMKTWNTQNVERFIWNTKIQGAFMPYEECGVEVFYVRLGYSSDDKKLPNFNRGTLDSLKWALKANDYKKKKGEKTPTKKDDIIKILLKL